MSRSRWHTSVDATKRAVGLLALLLAISGMWPLPLINVLPAITIVLLAIAYLQEDGFLLAFLFVICIASLLAFGFLVWTSAGALENLPKRIAARAVAVRLKDAVFRGASLSWK